jgi:hypothetical protein
MPLAPARATFRPVKRLTTDTMQLRRFAPGETTQLLKQEV